MSNTKTLEDCARCPRVAFCSAHVADGEWKYDQGVDPCKVIVE